MKRNIKDRASEMGGPEVALKGSPALPIADQFEDEPYEKEVKPGIAALNAPQVKGAKIDPNLVKFDPINFGLFVYKLFNQFDFWFYFCYKYIININFNIEL